MPNGKEDGGGYAETGPIVLATFLPYRFSILGERLSRALGRVYQDAFGISIPEWRVMAVLGECGSCSTRQIMERTEMDRVKVSRAVIHLADMALVKQKPLPHDQRAHTLNLTRRGSGIYRQILPMARALEAEFVSVLSPEEMKAMDTILTKLHLSASQLGALR